jgi:FtsP/CotA-like multicopper oxidase with cupredoxin domain
VFAAAAARPTIVGIFAYSNARSRRRSLPPRLLSGGRGPKRFAPGLILAILLLLPVIVSGYVVARAEAWGSGNTSITSFSVPLPIPAVLAPTKTDTTTDYYTLTMKTGTTTVVPGRPTTIWGYNGTWPGPTIVAQAGRQVAVHLVNNLPESMSMHLHGGHQASTSDGLPNDLVAPGGSKDYLFPTAGLTARTLWYHDHAMNTTATHVYEGLAGLFIVKDSAEAGMNLPSGAYDVPLLLQDRTFNSDGSLNYGGDGSGDTMMVNGRRSRTSR